jgi:hypothetical protein
MALAPPMNGHACRLIPVPCPGASRFRSALIGYARGVPKEPAAHDEQFSSFPCACRYCTGKRQEKETGEPTASRPREERLEVGAITVLEVVARSIPLLVGLPSLWRAIRCSHHSRDIHGGTPRWTEQGDSPHLRGYMEEHLLLCGTATSRNAWCDDKEQTYRQAVSYH